MVDFAKLTRCQRASFLICCTRFTAHQVCKLRNANADKIQRRSANLIHPRRSFLPLALLLKLGISRYSLGFASPQSPKIFADHHINLLDRRCKMPVDREIVCEQDEDAFSTWFAAEIANQQN